MSRLSGCPCGMEQHDTQCPTPNLSHIITDPDLDAVIAYSVEPETIKVDAFEKRAKEAWFCWNCGRLLILEKDRMRIFEEQKCLFIK